jgi:hypothetical protein
MKRKLIPLLAIPILLVVLIVGCVDLPNETIAPSWDVPLYFPLLDTTFVLEDMIGDDSTIVASDNPASLGLLYYQQQNEIDPFMVDSNLTINGFSTTTSQVIGAITINDVDPISTSILVTDWAPTVSPGDTMIFPESENSLVIPFPKVDAFSLLTLDDGVLTINIQNNLPVDLELRGILIRNVVGRQIVASHTTTLVIPAESSDFIALDLAGKIIEDSLQYEGTLYSSGSNNNPVLIPVDAGTELTGTFSDLVVAEVEAVLPEQDPFTTTDVVVFDDSTMLETAIFDDGNFAITFGNNLDVAINLDIEIDNLIKSDGTTYTETVSLDRNELNRVISYPDLSNWRIISKTGAPTNELSYSAVVNTITSSSPSNLSKDDSVTIDIDFGDVTLSYVEGIITPVNFDIAETNFDFDLGDIKDKFTYESLTWGNPGIILTLNSSANMEIELNGLVNGSNGSTENSMNVDVELAGGGTEVVDLRDYGFVDFMNGFSDAIPNTFSFSGTAIVNPEYKNGSVEKTESITGSINIEIPLDVGIAGGSYIDTMNVDSIDIGDETIDAINSLSITIEMTNAIPVGISISGSVLDELGNELFPFPPTYNENSEIIVAAPTVDENGYVISPSNLTQTIELQGEDAKLFLKNPNLYLDVKLNTPSTNPVKFRNTDSIGMKVYGHLNYRVNSESD